MTFVTENWSKLWMGPSLMERLFGKRPFICDKYAQLRQPTNQVPRNVIGVTRASAECLRMLASSGFLGAAGCSRMMLMPPKQQAAAATAASTCPCSHQGASVSMCRVGPCLRASRATCATMIVDDARAQTTAKTEPPSSWHPWPRAQLSMTRDSHLHCILHLRMYSRGKNSFAVCAMLSKLPGQYGRASRAARGLFFEVSRQVPV